jgi:phage-related protein
MVLGTEAKPLVWLHGEIKTPPFSVAGRIEAGALLRELQNGVRIGMPHSRPLPAIGANCHELRLRESCHSWRIVYFLDEDAIVIIEVFAKTTRATPLSVIETCRRRLAAYRQARRQERNK